MQTCRINKLIKHLIVVNCDEFEAIDQYKK